MEAYSRDVIINGCRFEAGCAERQTFGGRRFGVWTRSPWHTTAERVTLYYTPREARVAVDYFITRLAPVLAAGA